MARRPGEDRFNLSPRARRIAGWIAAVALVAGIALGVRIIGGSGEGSPHAQASTTPSGPPPAPITFGTALDPETGFIATPARTTRFAPGETFAYAARDVAVVATVYVEVERLTNGNAEVVQPSSPQAVPAGSPVVAFTVPVDVLLDAWGPGDYRMRIYLEPAGAPAAEGVFTLLAGA